MQNSNSPIITFSSSCLPISKKLHNGLNHVLSKHSEIQGKKSIIVNFRDKSYSAENGGYHPVEIALSQVSDDHYSILYITDFSYCGNAYPELERDIDFDIGNSVVFSRYAGWQSIRLPTMTELYELWEGNFLSYMSMDAYDQIQVECN
ncbi:hypothetical protein AB733_06620 [Photobacterium swingsii]|uniref:DUF2787 domain-containing protein n=1 Tax=Photobacterium swingsii TaxID=680026 RepID=A0A0J8VCL7_9GAMM|nr:DUF2787 domain-containing protein [Photobacterium swingsii]KMV31198.1 hypothetical protein AB733_06620 [Photobacterium swingsii]PSW24180.1 DUF2787 domain-containing protein [Photobacterium swingsii]